MTRSQLGDQPDRGPEADSAIVTYSRVSTRGRRSLEDRGEPVGDRREPVLDAREIPYANDDELRAYDPERGAAVLDDDLDDLAPRRGRRGGRRGARGAILIGAIALAAGMVILAYAYGIATRGDLPSASSAGGAGAIRTTLPTDAAGAPADSTAPAAKDAVPVRDAATPSTNDAAPAPAQAVPATPPEPKARTEQAVREPAAARVPRGAEGVPMDGDVAPPVGGAQPALVAPVPTTTTPSAPKAATQKTTAPAPAPAEAAQPPQAASPAGTTDSFDASIERLLRRDGATSPASGQAAPVGAPTASVPPPPVQQQTVVSDPATLPTLPDPNAAAPAPPVNLVPPAGGPIPPADIPNVPQGTAGTGTQ
jgi:hypothetical protein